jgi:hypothetical protein
MYAATTPHLHYPTINILLYPHRVEQTYSEIHPHTRIIADSHEKSTIRKKQNGRYQKPTIRCTPSYPSPPPQNLEPPNVLPSPPVD